MKSINSKEGLQTTEELKLGFWWVSTLSVVLAMMFSISLKGQEYSDVLSKINTEQYLNAISKTANGFDKSVDKYTQKALAKMLKVEQKMKAIVMKKDSMLSRRLFDYAIDSIQSLKSAIKNKQSKVEVFLHRSRIPYVDSLKKTLLFFEKNASVLNSINSVTKGVSAAKDQIRDIEAKLDVVNKIQAFLQDRKGVLGAELKSFPQLAKRIQKYRKEAFYYKAQMVQYKEILASPDKIEKLVLGKLQTVPAFQKLSRQLSGPFGSLFGTGGMTPGQEPVITDSGSVLSALPSKASVQRFIQTSSPGSSTSFDPMEKVRQQADKAGYQMPPMANGLAEMFRSAKSKLASSDDQGDKDDFTPNSQRIKSFWKRIDYGADLQFGKSVNYLPSTTNITLKLGYKLDDKKAIGIGVAYIMGMGTGWKNIVITHQGIGLKSYIKWNWKKGFALQGEAGWNYMAQFKNIEELKNNDAWQKSGLAGISKDIKFTKKVKANIQFMFDVFYRTHIPYSQPTVFRFGYGF